MKKFAISIFTIIILAGVVACSNSDQRDGRTLGREDGKTVGGECKRELVAAFQQILDSADVTGAILVFDPAKNTYYSNDFSWCESGHLPASTFKIPNSIIALETGVMESDSTLIKWSGEKRRLPVWEHDMTFRDAFHLSCVPCYQEIARKIGVQQMKEYLSKFDYGHMIVDSASIDLFWLEGDSKISQFEQIDFLYRFYNSKLPVSARAENIMKRLMVIEENDTIILSGKTGWSIRNGNNNGWFVGYLKKGEEVLFFATNIDPKVDFNMDLFAMIRKEISMKALKLVW
jgi:beta-lactamase class D